MGHIGVGIVSPLFNVSKGSYIGQCTESYGSWDNICAYHKSAPCKNDLIHDIKTKQGDIVKIDLDLNNRTFFWEINGQRITQPIKNYI